MHHPETVEEQEHAYKRRSQRRDRIKVFLETLTAIGVLAYGYIAARQLLAMLTANENSKQALEDVQRAYFYNSGVEIGSATGEAPNGQNINYATIFEHYENFGDTPARETTLNQTYCVGKPGVADLPNDFNFAYPTGAKNRITITPKGKQDGRIKIPIIDLNDVRAQKASLFLWGTIAYKDVFDISHVANFCQHAIGLGWVPSVNGPIMVDTFASCAQHNCEDDDCPKHWGDNKSFQCRPLPQE
jgi:hypothetical protein